VLDTLSAAISAHAFWAGPLFGLLALGESTAVVGVVIPATPILFLVGTLIGSGRLDPYWILPWAITGAIVGYWLSWKTGRRWGTMLYRTVLMRDHRRGIARARLFFRRWGGPSLILGRYVLGPFQSMLPLVAGAAAMGPRPFHAWNIASGIIWVFVVLIPGYLTAQGVVLLGIGAAQQRWLTLALLFVSGGAALCAVTGLLIRWRRRTIR
jgi:membrane protein DedA with SNARE-associated domain